MQAERIVPPPGTVIKWGGLNYKPAPDEGWWFVWDSKAGGRFDKVHEDNVPDGFWAELAKKALLG